jgi:hypothetical protein
MLNETDPKLSVINNHNVLKKIEKPCIHRCFQGMYSATPMRESAVP